MYIFLFLITFNLFFYNLNNFFLLYPILLVLIYFINTKNIFSIFEYNLFIEDRINILLENIIKLDYNLYLLFFLFITILLLFNNFSKLIYLYFILAILEINFNYQTFYFIILYKFNLNVKLLNGLFLIHPYCIYSFYSLILVYVYLIFNSNWYLNNNNLNKFLIFNYKNLVNYFSLIIIFGIVAISLGAWWSYQEINWAGWWSWDLIELINLILIIWFLVLLHNFFFQFNINFIKYSYINFMSYFILLLLISRFNIINSLHSFVVLNNFEQFSYIFIMYIILILLISKQNWINQLNLKLILNFSILNVFFIFLFNLYIYKILYELIIFIFNLNSYIEFLYFYKNINYVLFIMFSFIFLKIKIFITTFLIFFSFSEIILLCILISNIYMFSDKYFKYHLFLLFFIYILYFKIFFLEFSYKFWKFNFYTYIETYKININFIKKNYYFITNLNNNIYSKICNCFFISDNESNFLNFSKKCIYSLSNFFFYFKSILIISYKYLYAYIYSLVFFYSLYIYIYFIFYFFIFLKKKLVLLNIY